MRIGLMLMSVWLSLALAGACDQPENTRMVGQKTEVTAFGEQCLGFDLGGATEKPYNVTALSVPLTPGQTLMPVNETRDPVNTLNQQVRLEAGRVEQVRVRYQEQRVAYLQVDFEVSTERGTLYREDSSGSREIAAFNPTLRVNFLWGLAWVATFGVIGLFAWPNGTAATTYHEVVPLDAAPIVFRVTGGGGCLAVSGANKTITVHPNELRPGGYYRILAGTTCGSLFEGNKAYTAVVAWHSARFRWQHDGQWVDVSGVPCVRGSMLTPDGDARFEGACADPSIPGSLGAAGLIDRGAYETDRLPSPVYSRIKGFVPRYFYRYVSGVDEDQTEGYRGNGVASLPDHPTAGPVGILGNGIEYSLVQPLADSAPLAVLRQYEISHPGWQVQSVSWRQETRTAPDGAPYTVQTPTYTLGSQLSPDIEIVWKTRTLGSCRYDSSESTYDCGPYGTYRSNGGTWQLP